MEVLKSFRNANLTKNILAQIRAQATRPVKIMEICGGQTHAIMQSGLDQLLPPEVELIHGPGCPVCVTSLELIDQAIQISQLPEVIFTSFGDMLRVPGSEKDLLTAKAESADVRVVYSPLDAVKLAQANPDKQVVFFAVGFETTVPSIAQSVLHASRQQIDNFSILPANVLVPPAIRAILDSPGSQVNAFLAAGHVCAVMGYWQYEPIAQHYHCPIIVSGFEPLDLAQGILMAVKQLEKGQTKVKNAYGRVVSREGNQVAQAMISKVFEVVDRKWRGIGVIPMSGLGLAPQYQAFDAVARFKCQPIRVEESPLCQAGQVLQGLIKPIECSAFGKQCTPATPLGAPMVSAEGTCAAYFRYHRESAYE